MKRLCLAAVVIGLAAYAVAFYTTPLPSVRNDAGQPLLRGELLAQVFLLPDHWLFPNWFGTPPQFSLVDRLPVLLVAGVILAWAAVLGWLLMVLCRFYVRCGAGVPPALHEAGETPAPQLWPLEVFVFSVAIGLNVLSTWVLLLGLFGAMDRLWMFALPALGTVVTAGCFSGHSRLTAAGQDAKKGASLRGLLGPGYCSDRHDTLSPRWLWPALPFALAILLAGMLPPLDFDVREYHLQAPKEFFLQGRITLLPHNVYANMALGTEMLSLLAMVMAGDWWLGALAGKTVIAMFTPLTALALLLAGRRLFTPAAGVIAAIVYLSVPWVVSMASGGLVEGASACYLFLAVYALLLHDVRETAVQLLSRQTMRSTHPTSHFALAGYLAGAAVATKYPAVLFVLLPLAVWVVSDGFLKATGARLAAVGTAACGGSWPPFRRSPNVFRAAVPAAAKRAAVFLLAAALGCGLWFGKNWILAGNPTYPLLYEVFDGKTWNAQKEEHWSRVHRPHDFSAATLGKDLGRVLLTSEWLSPLIVPLAVLAFVGWTGNPSRRWGRHSCLPGTDKNVCPTSAVWALLAYIGFVIAVWWLLTHRIDRFWLPVLPVAALLAGAGACWSSEHWWRRVLAVVLAAGLGANFLVVAAGQGNAWFVSLARLRHDPGWIDPWHEYFNTHMTEGRLLCVGDAAVFDLTVPVLYNTCFDDCIFEQLVRGKTAAEVRAALVARHITYVYVNWDEIDRYRSPGNYGFTDFVHPEVFDWLAAEGVLKPLSPIEGHKGRGYLVKTEGGGKRAEEGSD